MRSPLTSLSLSTISCVGTRLAASPKSSVGWLMNSWIVLGACSGEMAEKMASDLSLTGWLNCGSGGEHGHEKRAR